jgi:hypothetical protein
MIDIETFNILHERVATSREDLLGFFREIVAIESTDSNIGAVSKAAAWYARLPAILKE